MAAAAAAIRSGLSVLNDAAVVAGGCARMAARRAMRRLGLNIAAALGVEVAGNSREVGDLTASSFCNGFFVF